MERSAWSDDWKIFRGCNIDVTSTFLLHHVYVTHDVVKIFSVLYIASHRSILSTITHHPQKSHSSKMYAPSEKPLRNNRFDVPYSGPSTLQRKRPKLSIPIKLESYSAGLPHSISNSATYVPTYSPEYNDESDSDTVHSIPHSPKNVGQQNNSLSRALAKIKGKNVLNDTTTMPATSVQQYESSFQSNGLSTGLLSSTAPQEPTHTLPNSIVPCSAYPVSNTPLPPRESYNSIPPTEDDTTFCIDEALRYIGSKLDTNFMEIISNADPILFCIKKPLVPAPLAFVLCTEDHDPIEGLKQLSILSDEESTAKLIWITKNKIAFFERDLDNPLIFYDDLVFLRPICPPTDLFSKAVDIHMEMFKLGVVFHTGLRRVKKTQGLQSLKSDFSAFFFDLKQKRHQIFIHYIMDTLEVVKNKRGRKRKIQWKYNFFGKS